MTLHLKSLLNLIYPPECAGCRTPTIAAHGLCPRCWGGTRFISGTTCRCCAVPMAEAGPDPDTVVCEVCTAAPPAWDRGRAAVLYEGAARDIVLSFKHSDRLDLAPVLGKWLARAGRPLLDEADILAPVPLHWTRMIKRRYNQAAELTRQPGLGFRRTSLPDLLLRKNATAPQKNRSRADRFAAMADAFAINPRHAEAIQGKNVLLVDDVLTTGATLSACAAQCRIAGAASVDVLVVARVAREGFAHI